jgi:hypothetical protein
MERIRRSWHLVRASWAVLRQNWSLLRFPLVASVLSTIVALLAIGLLWGPGITESDMASTDDAGTSLLTYGGVFVLYLVLSFVVVYCNTALTSLVLARFAGREPGGDAGWSAANRRWKQVLGWSAISATVGVLLSVLRDRSRAGGFAAAIGGEAWSLATFLVIPVLVIEDIQPITAAKRSASLLKRTWGEQIVGTAGLGLVTGLVTLVVVLIGGGIVWLAVSTGHTAAVVAAVIPVVVALMILIALNSALGTIYRAAVYQYATGQPVAGFGEPDLLNDAFTRS